MSGKPEISVRELQSGDPTILKNGLSEKEREDFSWAELLRGLRTVWLLGRFVSPSSTEKQEGTTEIRQRGEASLLVGLISSV